MRLTQAGLRALLRARMLGEFKDRLTDFLSVHFDVVVFF
jgi:hypothetical protein